MLPSSVETRNHNGLPSGTSLVGYDGAYVTKETSTLSNWGERERTEKDILTYAKRGMLEIKRYDRKRVFSSHYAVHGGNRVDDTSHVRRQWRAQKRSHARDSESQPPGTSI